MEVNCEPLLVKISLEKFEIRNTTIMPKAYLMKE